jgi:hypothetical protein
MGKQLIETFEDQYSLETRRPDLTVNFGATVKDGFSCEKGDVMGVITASGLLRRRTKTTVDTTAFSTAAATGKLADVTPFVAGDVLKNAAGATIGTIQSINTATRVVTLTGNAAVNVADGAGVYGSDGSEVASVIAEEGSDGDGDTPINVITQSPALDISKLRGLDDTAITDLGGKKLPGNVLKF